MSTLSPPHGANGAPPDDLFARVLSANPFTDNRVSGPAPEGADVAEVHRAAFDRLTALAREALTARRGLGAVLWGEAGVGKSHVLARLGRWAEAEGQAPFVYLHNLQASPDGLPRALLRAAVATLTRGRAAHFAGTPLFRLAASFAHEAFGYDPAARPSWPRIERAWGRLIDREGAGRAALVDRTAYAVLLRFFRSTYTATEGRDDGAAAPAVRWLAGEYLAPAEAERLGLPPAPARGEPVGLADNQQVKQVLVALSRLALAARQPFVLGFDQVDNLDDEQMAALARFLEALLDAAPNLLVVTAGVQATLLHWRQARVIQDSAWDRLAQFEVRLQRVTPAEAERLVAARLADFFGALRGRDALPPDPLFPLGETSRAEALRGKVDLRPRDVVNWAREGFRSAQEALAREGGPAWLTGWGRLPGADRPGVPPPDADALATLVAGLLEQYRALGEHSVEAVERTSAKSGARPAYNLLLRRRAGERQERSWLVFVATANALSTTGSLRRFVEAADPAERVFLVTDQRRPLALGLKGEEYLARLREGCAGRFRHVELTPADYAELDALRAAAGREGPERYRAAPLLRDLLGELDSPILPAKPP